MESGSEVGRPQSPDRDEHVNPDSEVGKTKKRRWPTGYYCAVPLCSNRSGVRADLSYHRFLTNTERRKRWVQAIRRDIGKNFAISSNTRVCSAHFTEKDYRRTDGMGLLRLVEGAVPSVFAWSKPSGRRVLQRRTEPSDVAKAQEQPLPDSDQQEAEEQADTSPSAVDKVAMSGQRMVDGSIPRDENARNRRCTLNRRLVSMTIAL